MADTKQNRRKFLNDGSWLKHKYVVEGLSTIEIGRLLGCTREAVRYSLHKHNIQVNTVLKHPKLEDTAWLKEKYEKEQLSTTEIAKIVGCTKSGVQVALKRNKIELRSSADTIRIQCEKNGSESEMYPLLNDEQWLRKRYLDEGKSLTQISELVGAKNHNSVRQGLQRFGISIRNISDGLTLHREDDGFVMNESVFTGCMLGDATMKCWNRESPQSYPAFRKKNKSYDHVMYVAGLFFGEKAKERVKPADGWLKGKLFPAFRMDSYCHKELRPYFDKWYPAENKYAKVVPSDIRIDEAVLLHWFMDDGSTSFRPERNNSVRLWFCSESFSREDNQQLCDLTNDVFSLRMKPHPCDHGTGWRIKIPESQTNKFFDIIGPCPVEVPSMGYKWKIRAP